MKLFITGGAGFIGSALIRYYIQNTKHQIINIDKLSYAANLNSLSTVDRDPRYHFEHTDICNRESIKQLLDRYQPDAVIHLAGESHVDRSFIDPNIFVSTNVVGTQTLLECSRQYYDSRSTQQHFRFLYVSTDEVYGSRAGDETVDEKAAFQPNSPYAASKAAATHLVRSYFNSYQFPVLTTYCSNNFGPWQYPEKLIPVTIRNALQQQVIPIYGTGQQSRDWVYVDDHVLALDTVLRKGKPGEGYNINGGHEISNLRLVHRICDQLDFLSPAADGRNYRDLIQFVEDRPGHDRRYGISDQKIRRKLGWSPAESFDSGLEKTLLWHMQTIFTVNKS